MFKRCPIDANNFCHRHNKIHSGRLLELSQMETELGEKYRLLWDGKNEAEIKQAIKEIYSTKPTIPTPSASVSFDYKDLKNETCTIIQSKPGALREFAFNEQYTRAFKLLTERYIESIESYPTNQYNGRGIVIAAGGKYFPSAYVTVRIIRQLNCPLPIQIWYFGRANEIDQKAKLSLQPYGVEFIDADQVRQDHEFRMLNGFEIKLFAVQHSPFEEVLFLDADSYPAIDPQYLFDLPEYRANGAIFWPDLIATESWTKWDLYRVEKSLVDMNMGFETGQFLINKQLCWNEMNLANWYNAYSDLTYNWDYGDKGPLRVAFARLQHRYVAFRNEPGWLNHSYLQHGPGGELSFIHRCRDKFRWKTDNSFHTPQTYQEPTRENQLPHEEFAFQVFRELNDYYFSLPSADKQVKNFVSSMFKYVATGLRNVTDDQYDQRLKTCLTCEHRTQDWRCQLCGCFVKVKAKMQSESCPASKWSSLESSTTERKCSCGR